ncbi:hypothetical protein VZT92_003472 [Zoarces viviparus]|uniref:Uncharacterized protein n=1 Tax=Zoarces viviparus TaxID=48416 RepID=A0AAW1FUW8_ZOAVI
MQQIYRQSDQHLEVYTTVFSPRVCRSGTGSGTRHVEEEKGGDSSPPMLVRRGSVPVAMTTEGAPCGCTSGLSTPRLLRKNSVRRPLGLDWSSVAPPPHGSPVAPPPHGSPSLLHRVLSKSRRKSCPHLPPAPLETGSINTAFQPD